MPSTGSPPDPSATAVSSSVTTPSRTSPGHPRSRSTVTTVCRAAPMRNGRRAGRVTVGDRRRGRERMGRARRARKIAATAAYGGGGVAAIGAALGAAGWGVIKAEAALARRVIGSAVRRLPRRQRHLRRPGAGEPYDIVVLGDSSAAGHGRGGRPRDGRRDHRQRRRGPHRAPGAADQPGRRRCRVQRPRAPARQLARGRHAARRRADHGRRQRRDPPHRAQSRRCASSSRPCGGSAPWAREVVVGTCPDLGTIQPIRQPLRSLMKRWSRDLAAAQTVAVVEAGGRTVSLGDLIGPGVRGVAARDVQQGPVPPVGGRLRPGGRGAAAERVRRPRGVGCRHHRPGPRARAAARASGRSRWRPGTPSRSPAPRWRRPRSPGSPAGRAGAGRSPCGAGTTTCRRPRTPRSRPRASRRARTTRSPRRRPDRPGH